MTTDSIKELVKRLRDTYWSGAPYMRELLDKSADALEAMAGEVLAAEKRNLESSVNALGWMRLSDALKHIIWKHPDAAKEMMAANLPPLPAPEDAVKLTAERDRVKAALEGMVHYAGHAEWWQDEHPEYLIAARKALGGDA